MAKEGIDVDVEWSGLEELEEMFDSMQALLHEQVNAEMHQIGPDASRLMEAATPFRTGYLRSRNQIELFDLGFRLFNDAEYAKYQNWGTRHIPPQHFLETAKEYASKLMRERLPKIKILN